MKTVSGGIQLGLFDEQIVHDAKMRKIVDWPDRIKDALKMD